MSHGILISHFASGDLLRSRSVSDMVLTGTLDVPAPPQRLLSDWDREISSQLMLEAGDVEPMPLARARTRWPDYRRCVQAVSDWTDALGLPGVLASGDVALMACRGAKYHHDAAQYGGAAFCNLFMSEDKGLDLHFPHAGLRIPLQRGTVVIFDTGQPHGVIRRGGTGFDTADFADGKDCSQVFLTGELPIEDAHVTRALRIDFDAARPSSARPDEEQLMLNGSRAVVCPESGRWLDADD